MKEIVSKKARKALVVFLLLMLLCTGISRGMASITTPKVEVKELCSKDLANITSDYITVEKKNNILCITIATPTKEKLMVEGDTIALYNLVSFQNETIKVEHITEKDGMDSITIPLSSENYEEGQTIIYNITHTLGSYYSCIPLKALHTSRDKTYVLVLEEKETVLGTDFVAKRIDVTIDAQDAEYASINSKDLTTEDKIITDSNKIVEKGDVVRLAEED